MWLAIGGLGQLLFFLRFLIQWRASERAGRSVVPASFWWMSLGGSLLMGAYSCAVREPVLAVGFAAGAWLYGRNLVLGGSRERRRGTSLALEIAAVACILALVFVVGAGKTGAGEPSTAWLAVAVVGQLLWSSRFVVQWIASERAGRSYFPRAFWWISLAGNLLLLAYAAHRGDPLLVIAFAFGPLVQIRNLMLGRAARDDVPESMAQHDVPGAAADAGLAIPRER